MAAVLAGIRSMIWRPFIHYNHLLETHPLATKSVTSGFMYAGKHDYLFAYCATLTD